ncbi:unnamed protein product, partial [Thelazia callipaeda]|uniref:Hydrolase_4 domain-containing protein n=1 Tax=Thelazia callipaeda TaxID=103827 RepID=A0A0N5CVM3_THECL
YEKTKIAFWPPPREYYFFVGDNTLSTISESDRELLTKKHHIHIACVFVRKSKPRYTLLFSHPNGSDLSDHLLGLPNLHDVARFFNCNVCSYDYSGYGISEGNPNEKNMFSDINAVYKYLLEDLCIPEANIILWGYSIGTVASVELALQANKLAGLILLAPIASILRTLCWRKCCWDRSEQCGRLTNCFSDRFDIVKKIGEIEMPTLIAHGVQDMIVTIEHGKALYRQCPGAVQPLWIPDVGHNNLENSALLWSRIRKFINNELNSENI